MIPDQAGFILKISSPDDLGIAAAVTGFLAEHSALILETQHFRDPPSNFSLLRLVFEGRGAAFDIERISRDFHAVATRFQMQWELHPLAARPRVVVAVSRQGHCINSLLHCWSVGTLHADIVAVVSNHQDQRRLAEWHGLPFHYFPITVDAKEEQEKRLLALVTEVRADLLVLARYMQILTSAACKQLAGRAINIHHSFLPGFKGAKPYHQAHARGVKLIGATAHYVNEDLDEGPIIEQAVERVDHTMSIEQLTTMGAEIESRVLNRAVQWHAEHRVFQVGNRALVLR